MTDFFVAKASGTPAGSGSNTGLTAESPKETIAQVLALSAFTTAGDGSQHTIFFRAGVYDSELEVAASSTQRIYLNSLTDCTNLSGYQDEAVVFRPASDATFQIHYGGSIDNNTGADITITIQKINFVQNGSNNITNSFIRPTFKTSSAHKVIYHIKECTFNSTDELVDGSISASVANTAGNEFLVENCSGALSKEHILNFGDIRGTVTVKGCDFTLTQPAASDADDVAFAMFFQQKNSVSATSKVILDGNKITINLDDVDSNKQIFKYDYINEAEVLNNTFTINPLAGTTSTGPIDQVFRFFNSTSAHASHTHRQMDRCIISGNTIINNSNNGVDIQFTGATYTANSGAVVEITDNQFITTEAQKRTDDTTSHVLHDFLQALPSLKFSRNLVKGKQDGLRLHNTGAVSCEISYNTFEDMGEDASEAGITAPDTGPCVVNLEDCGTTDNRVQIHNNIFDIAQKQMVLSLNDSGDTDSFADIFENTFRVKEYKASAGDNFSCYNVQVDGDTNFSFSDNKYLSYENARADRCSTYNNASKSIAQTVAQGSNNSTTNLVKKTTSNLISGRLTQSLGL